MTLSRRRLFAGLAACPLCGSAAWAQATSHWDYEAAGPEKWASLDSKFGLCAAGDQQSPVDLHDGLRVKLPAVDVRWKPEVFQVVNNGHTLQLNANPGNLINIGNEQFDLVQFHFHTPSEHAVSGRRTAMEAHFVHQQQSGRLAVLGVLLVVGQKNDMFSAILTAAPPKDGQKALSRAFNPTQLLPKQLKSAWRYEGSLTTPPCSQVVDWIVMDQTVSVAQTDVDAFHQLFPMNARPLQPLNRRYILRS